MRRTPGCLRILLVLLTGSCMTVTVGRANETPRRMSLEMYRTLQAARNAAGLSYDAYVAGDWCPVPTALTAATSMVEVNICVPWWAARGSAAPELPPGVLAGVPYPWEEAEVITLALVSTTPPDLPEARQTYEQLIECGPRDCPAVVSNLSRIVLLHFESTTGMGLGVYPKELSFIQGHLRQHPPVSTDIARVELAICEFKRGRRDEARKLLAPVAAAYKDCKAEKATEKARSKFSASAGLVRPREAAVFLLAVDDFLAGNYDESVARCKMLIATGPTSVTAFAAWDVWAQCLLAKEDKDGAAAILERRRKACEKHWPVYLGGRLDQMSLRNKCQKFIDALLWADKRTLAGRKPRRTSW